MHAPAWRLLSTSHHTALAQACRVVGGVRLPASRNFHRSAVAYRIPEEAASDAAKEDTDVAGRSNDELQPVIEALNASGSGANDARENSLEPAEALPKLRRRRAELGAAARRAARAKEAPGIPPFVIPEWFLTRNVRCLEDLTGDGVQSGQSIDTANESSIFAALDAEEATSTNFDVEKVAAEVEERIRLARGIVDEVAQYMESRKGSPGASEDGAEGLDEGLHDSPSLSTSKPTVTVPTVKVLSSVQTARSYTIPDAVYQEIFCTISADLKIPSPKYNIRDVIRPDSVLYCPMAWSTEYLDAIVQTVATESECDVIRLDSEDLAEILGDYLGENIVWTKSPTAYMGYDLQKQSDRAFSNPRSTARDEEDIEEEEDEDEGPSFSTPSGNGPTRKPFTTAVAVLQSPSKMFGSSEFGKGMSIIDFLGRNAQSANSSSSSPTPNDNWMEYKLGRALNVLLSAANTKRTGTTMTESTDSQSGQETAASEQRGLIVEINGYKELSDHPVGSNIITKLREIVKRRWFEGQRIAMVGTTADEDVEHLLGGGHTSLAYNPVFERPRVLFVPPEMHDITAPGAGKASTRQLNLRRLEAMLRKLSSTEGASTQQLTSIKDLKDCEELDGQIWDYLHVRRIATLIVGAHGTGSTITGRDITNIFHQINRSDEVRLAWVKEQRGNESNTSISDRDASGTSTTRTATFNKVEKLRDTCNKHEKRLLAGVIDPADLHTTFEDVRAPAETIEALKTLTSLSLIRPESFSYGVLAKDKISGLLLYGPPGTGKTLLAKAVAKQSGATVLEVSASEINDMYVGEGEKNVRAVFSLARKLSPCVVFIDEADALFQARGQIRSGATHRELINQFLREWDGMNSAWGSNGAFIMVATNRPFDLDEAVLRRLPRRLLVDLPVEKDREAILGIHLKEETLDPEVSLAQLAKDTPYYSGSDLKNLSVAAALACVREENAAAAAHTGSEPYAFPERRVLHKRHFDKAMDEISASISEDMSTLAAIRKFDEKYGDRKGRRKKGPALGFGAMVQKELELEMGRVRKVDALV